MVIINQYEKAYELLNQGKIIAYPTEAVYGLGCDPFNQQSVENLLLLKQRPASKGLILLIADWKQLQPLIRQVPGHLLQAVQATWPGPVTWIFPKSEKIPYWLSGDHDSIAIRMSAHPVAHALCAKGPIVSTSANISGQEPAMDIEGLQQQFTYGIEAVMSGDLGGDRQPSSIYDVLHGQRLR